MSRFRIGRNPFILFLILFHFQVIINQIYSQKIITTQNLIWYSNYTTLELNNKWYFLGEVQERHFMSPLKQHQFLVRGHIHYKIDEHWDFSSGMCLFLQDSNDPYADTSLTVPELRPHIECINR